MRPPGPVGPPRIETGILLTILAVTGALAGFAALADEVGEGGTSRIDRLVLLAFRVPGHPDVAIGPQWVQESARDVTALGGFTVLMLVSLAATAMLLIHGRRLQALVFVSTVALAQVASEALKRWIDRPRPALVTHLDLVYSSSFPSGHAMMTPAVYLTLAGILAAGERRPGEKALLLGGAAVLSAVVGVSRVYLGVHWPTDVLGGWALGSAAALTAIFVLRRTAARSGSAQAIAPNGAHDPGPG
jgi:undecaprenyl-diphosphatase